MQIVRLKTKAFRKAFKEITEDYGVDKDVDIMFSLKHTDFIKAYPNSTISEVYLDNNGNWTIKVNLVATIKVKSSENWEEIRKLYLTLTHKFKTNYTDDGEGSKKFIYKPESIDVEKIKVFKGLS